MMVSTRRLAETWKAFSCPFEEGHRALALSTLLSPPGDRWRGILGFVPDGSRDAVAIKASDRSPGRLWLRQVRVVRTSTHYGFSAPKVDGVSVSVEQLDMPAWA